MAAWPKSSMLVLAAAVALGVHRVAPQYELRHSPWLTGLALFALQLAVWETYALFLYHRYFSPLRHLPQPDGNHWLMGQWFRIVKEPSGHPAREWMDTIPNEGMIYYRSFFNSPRLLLTSPKAIGEALTTKSYELVKPQQLIQGIGRILGFGVLFAEGEEHKRQRKNLMPAFAYRHIKDLYPVFWDLTRSMVLKVDESLKDPPKPAQEGEESLPPNVVRIDKWSSRSTLDIIGVAGIGKSFNAIEDENSELYRVYQSIFVQSRAARFMGLLSLFIPFWLLRRLPVAQNAKIETARVFIRNMCLDIIKEKRARIETAELKGEPDAVAGTDILTVALKSGGFTDNEIVDQLMTFLAAGHETTATAMSWALLLLCQNPQVQTKLREELRSSGLPNIRNPSSEITADDIDRVSYLQAVINEVLRFHPPVPVTIRTAARDTAILGQFVPKGTFVLLAPTATNRHKAFWGDDANEFKPERWIGPGRINTGGAESNYANLTFLHGPRSCIGQGFSKGEFASLLAGWVMAYESELAFPDKEIEIQGGVTQRPKGGLAIKIRPIEA